VDDLVAEYGQLIVDECHHLSAVSFEAVPVGNPIGLAGETESRNASAL
jgi:hypothetical protein